MARRSLPVFLLPLAIPCACGGQTTPGRSRVEVVAPPEVTAATLEAFCDLHPAPASAPRFAWPDLADRSAPDDPGWSWVALWATWCLPCIAEMPVIAEWSARLSADGLPVAVHYLSVDASAEALERYRLANPGGPEILRVRDAATVGPWLSDIGIEYAGSIPIHIWVDPEDRIRCVRSGQVDAPDWPIVRRIVEGG